MQKWKLKSLKVCATPIVGLIISTFLSINTANASIVENAHVSFFGVSTGENIANLYPDKEVTEEDFFKRIKISLAETEKVINNHPEDGALKSKRDLSKLFNELNQDKKFRDYFISLDDQASKKDHKEDSISVISKLENHVYRASGRKTIKRYFIVTSLKGHRGKVFLVTNKEGIFGHGIFVNKHANFETKYTEIMNELESLVSDFRRGGKRFITSNVSHSKKQFNAEEFRVKEIGVESIDWSLSSDKIPFIINFRSIKLSDSFFIDITPQKVSDFSNIEVRSVKLDVLVKHLTKYGLINSTIAIKGNYGTGFISITDQRIMSKWDYRAHKFIENYKECGYPHCGDKPQTSVLLPIKAIMD